MQNPADANGVCAGKPRHAHPSMTGSCATFRRLDVSGCNYKQFWTTRPDRPFGGVDGRREPPTMQDSSNIDPPAQGSVRPKGVFMEQQNGRRRSDPKAVILVEHVTQYGCEADKADPAREHRRAQRSSDEATWRRLKVSSRMNCFRYRLWRASTSPAGAAFDDRPTLTEFVPAATIATMAASLNCRRHRLGRNAHPVRPGAGARQGGLGSRGARRARDGLVDRRRHPSGVHRGIHQTHGGARVVQLRQGVRPGGAGVARRAASAAARWSSPRSTISRSRRVMAWCIPRSGGEGHRAVDLGRHPGHGGAAV